MRDRSHALRNLLLFLFLSLFMADCASLPPPGTERRVKGNPSLYSSGHEYRAYVRALQKELTALGGDVSPGDAGRVAEAAIRHSVRLAGEYDLVRPPLFHNFLVNLGIRERGLCVHWTKDLIGHLRGLDQKSFSFHWAVAYREYPLFIHSSVVAAARNRPFEEGLVLDPWRNSGRLFWKPVKEDRYPWKREIL